MSNTKAKNTICIWFDKDALEAARFYAATFPDSKVGAICHAPGDYPNGKEGDVLTVEFTVCGISCMGINGGPMFKHSEAFSFQIATDTQAETDRYWKAIVSNGGEESACGWCKDRWGISWQITPRVLMDALAAGGVESLSENCERCCGEGFWTWPRRRGRSIPGAGCDDRANAGQNRKTRRPEGF